MLKLKYLFENFELAKQCLAQYDYDEETLDSMMMHFRISSNAIYPFRLADEQKTVCFLRLSPCCEKPLSHVESEIDMIQWLRNNGIHAMEPISMKNGKYASKISTSWGDYNVSCFAKVKGADLEETEGTLEIAFGYGKCLGNYHNTIKYYDAAEKRPSYKDMLATIHSRLVEYHAPTSILSQWDQVAKALDTLEKTTDNYGVVHYDFEPDNVFYDPASKEFGIIDFDDSIQCWFALDLVRAIDAMDDVVEESQVEQATKAFLDGYENVFPLNKASLDSFSLMRKLVALQEYSTILYVTSEPVKEEPQWMQMIKAKLDQKLHFLEAKLA